MPSARFTALLGALAAAACAVVVAVAAASTPHDDPRPNVVVIMTDDQTLRDMAAMPRTRRLIGDAGATFNQAYVSYPLCCPSRATFLTGLYAHNHGVRTNTPPDGGVEALDEEATLPVWLQNAGYRTVHIGKYLNGYGLRRNANVPPGWTDWHGLVDKSTYQMYGYMLSENGELNTYGHFAIEDPAVYQTDVLRERALEAIRLHGRAREPFFLSLNFVAPHGEVVEPGSLTQPYLRPALRHVGRYLDRKPPRGAYDEVDVSDKPRYVRALRRIGRTTAQRIATDFQARRESLIAVDEAVAAVVAELEYTGQLDSTYIVFTSDNGFFQGEHRITKGKYLAYDAATHVPLLVRGPGIAPGTVTDELVSNIDLAPTVLDAAGATAGRELDGRSLLPFARDGALRTERAILHEGLVDGDNDRDGSRAPGSRVGRYYAIRTGRYLFVKWRGGARELYDRLLDPDELDSRHADLAYAVVRQVLSDSVTQLRRCAGAACEASLPVPLPALTPVAARRRAAH